MRGWLATAAAIAIAFALAPAEPAAAGSPHRGCSPQRSYTYGTSARVSVFDVSPPGLFSLDAEDVQYVCDRLTGRRTEIGRSSVDDPEYPDALRFAGPVVGYRRVDCFRQTCDYSIHTVNARTGRKLGGGPVGDPIHDLVVARSGSAAWISNLTGPGGGIRVAKATAAGSNELDAGPGIEPRTLALSDGAQLYWTRVGLPQRAILDDPAAAADRADPALGGNRRCYPRKALTLGASHAARVYTHRRDGSERLVACNLRTGRRALIEERSGTEIYGFEKIRFAAPYVALAARGCDEDGCRAGQIRTVDLRTGTVRRVHGGRGAQVEVTDLVLSRTGGVAWIRGPGTSGPDAGGVRQVVACDADGCRTVGSGPEVQPYSLALALSGRLYWTGASGLPRSAPID